MDLAIYSAKIFTGDPHRPWAQSLLIKDGTIALVGDNEEIKAAAGRAESLVLPGRLVTPGLVDGHIHFLLLGQLLRNVDLRNLTSIKDCREKIRDAVQNRRPGEWILGHGWNQHFFEEGREPNRRDLDDLTPDHPVMMVRACTHGAWVNSRALELAGITADTPDPPGALILRDPQTGEPSGVLKECLDLVEKVIPGPSLEERMEMALTAQQACLGLGITSVHSHEHLAAWEALDQLDRDDRLKLRVHHTLRPAELEAALAQGIQPGKGSGRLWFSQVKMFADGTLGAGTALMHEPYSDEPGLMGCEFTPTRTMTAHITAAYEHGCDVAIHAIGDKALSNALDAIAAARAAVPGDHRDRIEHVQLHRGDDLKRFREMGLAASVQPVQLASDWSVADRRWGERTGRSYAYKTLLDMGIPLVFGADAPVEPNNPIFSLYTAVTRRDRSGQPRGGWHPEQALTLEDGLTAFTSVPAWCARRENVLGRLVPGHWADVTVWEQDLSEMSPEAWLDVAAEMTIVGGRVVYRK